MGDEFRLPTELCRPPFLDLRCLSLRNLRTASLVGLPGGYTKQERNQRQTALHSQLEETYFEIFELHDGLQDVVRHEAYPRGDVLDDVVALLVDLALQPK